VHLDGQAATIIGVMPEGWMLFNYPAQFWAPYRLNSSARGGPDRVLPLARLKPGVTLQQAQGEMTRFAAALAKAFPSTNKGWGIRLEPALEVAVGWVRQPLLIILSVVVFVLLIAGANVSGLLLAHSAGRTKEVAIRAALGAQRWHIVRGFLTESILLSMLGGLLGVGPAHIGLRLFVALCPAWFPRIQEIVLDTRMLGFTFVLSLVTALVFGAIPAAKASSPDLIGALKESTRGAMASIRHQRLRSGLVVLEISAAMILVIGAGLMLNTFLRLYSAATGCDIRNVLTFQVRLSGGQFVKEAGVVAGNSIVEISPRVQTVFEQIRERVTSIRGVESAAAGVRPPLSESTLGGLKVKFIVGDHPEDGSLDPRTAAWLPVSAGYFHSLRIPVVRGREFHLDDTYASLPVAVINEAMARRFWPGEDPIGKRLRIDLVDEPNRQIVGVVGDVRHNRYDRDAQPEIYVPHVQCAKRTQRLRVESRLTMTFVVRSASGLPLVPALRSAVAEVDPNLPIFNVKTLNDYLVEQLWQPRQTMFFLALFSAISMILAMTGIHGMMAYSVLQRTYEIGIRMALGATRRDVLRLMIVQGLLMVALGIGIGVAGSVVLTRFLRALLWGVTPTDPYTYAMVMVTLVMFAILVCYLAARRALDIDPVHAMRYE
jgi:putative ABC transport system permease protein